MAASATDKFKKAKDLFSTTLSSGIGSGDTTIPLNSTTGLATTTGVTLTIDGVDSSGTATPTSREVVTGTISGNNLVNVVRGKEGTQQSHSSGAVVTEYFTKTHWDDAIDGITADHNQDGTHKPSVIYDSNGNEQLEFTQTSSAVNNSKFKNSATGNNPQLLASGESNKAIDIYDSNANEMLKGSATASAINEFTIANAASGSGPTLSSTGGGTDIDINITPKGAGSVVIPKSTLTAATIKGLFRNVTTKTNSDSPYSIASTDTDVLYSTSSGASTATLPTAASVAGRTITVVKTSSDSNLLTIGRTSSQTINGVNANDTLISQGDFVTYMSDGSNWFIVAQFRKPLTATVATSETRTSTSYGDLSTAGPSITLAVGASGIAIIDLRANLFTGASNTAYMGIDVSGANTVAANDSQAIYNGSGTDMAIGGRVMFTGLTPGSTTFKAQYRVTGGTGTFLRRNIHGEAK